MKNNDLHNYPLQKLLEQKKKLTVFSVVLAGLIVLYGVYFILKLSSGTWRANSMLSTVIIGMLVVFISLTSVQISRIVAEINSRKAD
nr:hypothetical protein [Cytophagales bacterium]